jgi:hypothetical protein
MTKRIYTMALLGFMGITFVLPAFSAPRLRTASELSGIQNTLRVIRHVSLNQTALKSRQPILDIMDIKTQIEAPALNTPGVKATVLNAPIRPLPAKYQSRRNYRLSH